MLTLLYEMFMESTKECKSKRCGVSIFRAEFAGRADVKV